MMQCEWGYYNAWREYLLGYEFSRSSLRRCGARVQIQINRGYGVYCNHHHLIWNHLNRIRTELENGSFLIAFETAPPDTEWVFENGAMYWMADSMKYRHPCGRMVCRRDHAFHNGRYLGHNDRQSDSVPGYRWTDSQDT